MTPRRGALLARSLLLLGLVASACVGAAELVVRRFLPQPRGFSWLTEDGLQIHMPNRDAVYRRDEFAARVRFNSLGFRGPEFAAAKTAGRLRIAALGDSFIEGMQVDETELLTTRIARARDVEVLDLGVSGYGTDDARDVLRVYGPRLAPDLVMLFFCVANDFQNNALEGRCRRADGRLACADLARPSPRALRFAHAKSWLSTHSELYQALQAAATDPLWQRIGLRAPTTAAEPEGPSFLRALFADPPPPAVADAIAVTGDLLAALRDDAAALGAPLWLVVLPIREQVEDAEWARFAGGDPHALRDGPQQALARTAGALDIPVVDPLPAFRARDAQGERLYWRVDAHFNAVGHAVAAEAVVAALAAQLDRAGAPE